MSYFIRRGCVVALALIAMVAVSTGAQAGTCAIKGGTVTTSVFTGTPTVACPNGVPVVQVTITLNGIGGPFVLTDLRCGISDEPFVFTFGGFTHTISVHNGYDWEDVLNGNCNALGHRAR